VEKQIKEGIQFAKKRYSAKSFMAYFQTFSASFEPDTHNNYFDILSKYNFSAVTFGTRPDCITKESISFLKKLNKIIPVWIELGIQTIHNKTLDRINRRHNWQLSKKIICLLNEMGIKVAVHVIIGLPSETQTDIIETAKELSTLPINGIKIHNLHIIKNTQLAKEYKEKPFPVFGEHEYADLLIRFLRYLPSNLPVIRMSTDTESDNLIAPIWHINKNQFQDYVINKMICQEIRQGDMLVKSTVQVVPFKHVTTKDESLTFWNDEFKEHYHTVFGARIEAEQKYVVASNLSDKLLKKEQTILDIGFGMGYNSLSAMNIGCKLTHSLNITALEIDKRVVRYMSETIPEEPNDAFSWRDCLSSIYSEDSFNHGNASLSIFWNDARYSIQKLDEGKFDIVFMDAFSSQRNSELWTLDFFNQIKRIMKPSGILLTYSQAIPVLSGLIQAGFYVGFTQPIGLDKKGTIAAMRKEDILMPLTEKDLVEISSTRGIPYRDPFHILSNKDILRNREKEILKKKAR
ncbi:MAG: TIGR01212 family radical SAM protein, partial [Candidatus Margulisbacteria bacterium GWF2_35_9]